MKECVCICVCEREREKGRKEERKKERKRVSGISYAIPVQPLTNHDAYLILPTLLITALDPSKQYGIER